MVPIRYANFLAIFAFTFALGWLASGRAAAMQNPTGNVFTKEDALAHVNKKVINTCNRENIPAENTSGRTAFVDEDEFAGGYLIVIDWDYSFRGRHEIFHTDRTYYEKCIVEVGDAEH